MRPLKTQKVIKLFVMFVLSGLLVGCVTISTPQFTSLYNVITQTKTIDPLDEFKWELQYGDYITEVYLASTSQGLVFLSENKDIIFFDGDNISRVQHLAGKQYDLNYVVNTKLQDSYSTENNSNIEISASENSITYPFANQFRKGENIYTTYECTDWIEKNSNKHLTQAKISIQYCETQNGRKQNIQHFVNDKLIYIEQWYATLAAPLILNKYKR